MSLPAAASKSVTGTGLSAPSRPLQRGQGLPFLLQQRPQSLLQGDGIRGAAARCFAFGAARSDPDDDFRAWVGAGGKHAIGGQQGATTVAKPLQQQFQLLARVAIGLVEHEQHRAPFRAQLLQRLELEFRQIAFADHQRDVGTAADRAGQLLPLGAVQFVDARRVDQDDLSFPQGLPGLAAFLARFPVQGAGRESRSLQQCVEQRRLAHAHPPKGGDVYFALAQFLRDRFDLLEFGGELLAHGGGNAGVFDQFPQVAIRLEQVPVRVRGSRTLCRKSPASQS